MSKQMSVSSEKFPKSLTWFWKRFSKSKFETHYLLLVKARIFIFIAYSYRVPIWIGNLWFLARRLFAHNNDIIKDVFFVVTISTFVTGGGTFTQWVSTIDIHIE